MSMPTRLRFNLNSKCEIGSRFLMPSIGRRVEVVGCQPKVLWAVDPRTKMPVAPYQGFEITVRHA